MGRYKIPGDIKEYYKEKVVLVTGGAGAIGSNLVKAIGDLGAELVSCQLSSVG